VGRDRVKWIWMEGNGMGWGGVILGYGGDGLECNVC
jgi:hypothetical protein